MGGLEVDSGKIITRVRSTCSRSGFILADLVRSIFSSLIAATLGILRVGIVTRPGFRLGLFVLLTRVSHCKIGDDKYSDRALLHVKTCDENG